MKNRWSGRAACLACALVCLTAGGVQAKQLFFADGVDVATFTYGVAPRSVVDLDSDGDLDLLLSTALDSQIFWLENLPGNDGTYQLHTITHFNSVVPGPFSVVAGDLDGDGDLDVVASGQLTGFTSELAWFENDGNPRDGLWRKRTIQLGSPPLLFPPRDADGDGDNDIFGQLAASFNLFTNNLNTPEANWPRTTFGPFEQPTLTDIDRNGKPDILSILSSQLRRLEFTGAGQQTTTTYPSITLAGKFIADDFNGDGFPDLLKRLNDGKVYLHQNTADSNLLGTGRVLFARSAGTSTSQPELTQSIDLNGDGAQDVIINDSGNPFHLLNQGGYQPDFRIYRTYNLRTGTAFDYDEDGKQDLVVGNSSHLTVYTNVTGPSIDKVTPRGDVDDGFLMPGEAGTLEVTVKNLSAVPEVGGLLYLLNNDPKIIFQTTSQPIDDMNGKESRVYSFPFTLGAGAVCGSIINIPVRLERINKLMSEEDPQVRIGTAADDTFVFEESPALAIPDGDSDGLVRIATAPMAGQVIKSIQVSLNIQHTYRGDLLVKLVAPSGAYIPLFTGNANDSADDVVDTFDVVQFNGQQGGGEYKLQVIDRLPGETGTLNFWRLEVVATRSHCASTEELNALYRIMGIPHDTTGSDRNSDGIVDAADVVNP